MIKLEHFTLSEYDENKDYNLKNQIKDITPIGNLDRYILNLQLEREKDNISGTYTISNDDSVIGLVFVLYHEKEYYESDYFPSSIEFRIELLSSYRDDELYENIKKDLSNYFIRTYSNIVLVLENINVDDQIKHI